MYNPRNKKQFSLVLTEEIFDLDGWCVVGRFTVPSLVDGNNSELLFISLYQICTQELKSLNGSSGHLLPTWVAWCPRFDEVSRNFRASVWCRLRPRDFERVSRDVIHFGIQRWLGFSCNNTTAMVISRLLDKTINRLKFKKNYLSFYLGNFYHWPIHFAINIIVFLL